MKTTEDKTVPISVRLSPVLKSELQKAAEERGMLLTAFIRHAAVIVARRDEVPRRRARAAA